jgi:hypothetical protein
VRLWDVRKGGSASRSYLMSFDAQQDDHMDDSQAHSSLSPQSRLSQSSSSRAIAGGRRKRNRGERDDTHADDYDDDVSRIDFTARQQVEAGYSSLSSSSFETSDGNQRAYTSSLSSLSSGTGGMGRVQKREQARAASQAVDWSREGAGCAHSGGSVTALKYTPSGTHLVSCGNDGQVIYNVCYYTPCKILSDVI